MLSEQAKQELKNKIGKPNLDCDFRIARTSKWVVCIHLEKGLCLFAKFKFNCKNKSMERLV